MTDLIYGNNVLKVEHIDILNNISQDLANAIATGPQDEFFDKLDTFNADLQHYGIDSIDVTEKWNWKPGTYPKIDAYLNQRLTITKKAKDITSKLRRVREYANYLHYMTRNADELEICKYRLKHGGYARNVNIDEFKEMANIFANTINEQCDIAYDTSNGKVEIKPYIKITNNIRNSNIYFDIYIRDIKLNIYDGKTTPQLIQTISSEKDSYLRIIMHANLRGVMNKMNTHYVMTGRFISNDEGYLQHPYISQNSHASSSYSSVCLSSYTDDIQKSLINQDFMILQHHLLTWAQYYHNQFSNPYNKPNRFHLGFPKYLSEEYEATNKTIINDCGSYMRSKYKTKIGIASHLKLTRQCNKVECKFKDSCSSYKASHNTYSIYKNTDIRYEVESIVGYIKSYFETKNITDYYCMLDIFYEYGCDFSISLKQKPPEMNNVDFLFTGLYWYLLRNRRFDNLLNYTEYWKDSKETEKESNDSIENKMLKWATSSGRSE